MPKLTLDGKELQVETGVTVLEAARRFGITIPTLCHAEGCRPETSCLVCVVKVHGARRLLPACATRIDADMTVDSDTEEVRRARRMALELLLADHVGDCVGPCQTVCPAHLDIPGMARLIRAGRWEEAVQLVRRSIPIPAILGYICPELCERGCRRGDWDAPVAIRLLKRAVGEYALTHNLAPEAPTRASDKRVAVVGAGPAGIAAAFYLMQRGHACTVLEKNKGSGGGLRSPAETGNLPWQVLDAEVASALTGAELRTGVQVGRDESLQSLRENFHAVVLAVGQVSAEVAGELGIGASDKGLLADRVSHMTPLEGVFVAGAALHPTRHAVRSVGSGHAVAHAVDRYLAGVEPVARIRPWTVHMGKLSPDDLAAFVADAPPHGRLTPVGGEAVGFTEDEARAEADRCLHCDCVKAADCRLRRWAEAYGARPTHYRQRLPAYRRDASHPQLVYEPGKCIACGLCIQIAEQERERLGLSFIGRGFEVRVGVPFNESLARGLEHAARKCAQVCPTAALTWRADGPEDPV